MRFLVWVFVLLCFFYSPVAFSDDSGLMVFDEKSLQGPLDRWFNPDVCDSDPGEYFYISLGVEDASVLKIKKDMYYGASLSAWKRLKKDQDGNIIQLVDENMGCAESPMPVLMIALLAPEGMAQTGVGDNLFILKLDNQGHDKHLLKLRDSGEAELVTDGLLYSSGTQTINGRKQPVAYFLAQDPAKLQKSGGPIRARCLEYSGSEVPMCSVIDAINKEAVYEAVVPVWPPKLVDIQKLHSQMTDLVDSLRVQ